MPLMTNVENDSLEVFCDLVEQLNAIQVSVNKLLGSEDSDTVLVIEVVNKILVSLRAGRTQEELNLLVDKLESLELLRADSDQNV